MKLLNQIELKNILNDLTEQIEPICGDELVQMVLFGSYSDGRASAESDIDLLVVLESDNTHIVESIRDVCYNLMWDNDFEFIISLHFMIEDHYKLIKSINTSFYQEIIKKGVVLWERSRKKQPVG
jgi:uncharacterized protein